MPSRNWNPVALVALLVGVSSCGGTAADHRNGQLELVIVPDKMAASHRPLHGRFLLHGLDQPTRACIEVDAAGYLTRSVSLVPGSYALQWQPELEVEAPDALHPVAEDLRRAHTTEPRALLLIAAGRVTTMTVRSTLDDTRATPVVATSTAPPEPERIARY
jgi:hypothetical protein